MPLTDTAKAGDKPYKLADGGGLSLLVKPTGSRLWRLKYRIEGKEKLLAIGPYPDVTLAKARERRDDAKPSSARACPMSRPTPSVTPSAIWRRPWAGPRRN